ncbi:MAG: hypothetical protein COA58_12940 [Bacteroidetes bacterium]|nr:MAG: hypothetical protein COA58_12940 [Bacteroidota bacterium]
MTQNHKSYLNNRLSIAMLSLLFVFAFSCKKGELLPNMAPETAISLEKIDLTGNNRLNSTVNLTWFGTDVDGFIQYYEIKINEGEWLKTNIQDSTFLFNIDPDQDSTNIDFYVRAVDNEDVADPTPAYLKIPLKNSPPVVRIDDGTLPLDTTNLVITFRYRATDPDGNSTIKQAFLKANDGDWQEIDLNQKLISVIPSNTTVEGSGMAKVYYGLNTESSVEINGFVNGGDNILQMKVVDFANSESAIDSTDVIFVKSQMGDLLLVGGHNASITSEYEKLVLDNYPNSDFVDFAGNGGLNQPRFWNPSFRLLALNYDKVFFHTDEANFSNPLSGADGKLLDFAAPIIQELIDNNKKVLISTAFATGTNLDIIGGILSIDSFSPSKGQAFFTNDSFAFSQDPTYNDLQPANFLLAADPFYAALDAEVFYRANLTPSGGWTGPNSIAIRRRNSSGNINLVLFSVELHKLNKLKSNQNQVISKILNEAFNW